VFLVAHDQIAAWLGLSADEVLVGASLAAGLASLALAGRTAGRVLSRRVDWVTLAFFLLLFVVVGALEASGTTDLAARAIIRGTGGRPAAVVLLVGWSTGVTSAFLPNLLDIAAYLPIIAGLKTHGVACPTAVYWLMLFGGTFMGNLTNIGSTCNIIACGMARKRGQESVAFLPWLKIGAIVSLVSMTLATLLLGIQTGWLTRG